MAPKKPESFVLIDQGARQCHVIAAGGPKKFVLRLIVAMYLMYYLDDSNSRVYTLAKTDPKGNPTFSAHPARFSPEDQVEIETFSKFCKCSV